VRDHKIEVGLFGEDGHMLMIATVHEFGAPQVNIPERSFMRTTIDEKDSEISRMIDIQIGKVIDREISGEAALGRIGEYVKNLIQRRITDISRPPNKPGTIAQKGSSNPLIDTGRMRASITWRIV